MRPPQIAAAFLVFVSLGSWVSLRLNGQQAIAAAPQAAPFLARTVAVLSAGTRIKSANLTGTVTAYGPTSSATTPFTASATTTGQSQFNAANGLSESRIVSNGTPTGTVVGPGGTLYALSSGSSMTPSAWFMTVFTLASRLVGQNYGSSYADRETQSGTPVHHLQVWQQPNAATGIAAATLKSLTTEDIYINQATHLPVLVGFNLHLGAGALASVPVQVSFSNYQVVQNCPVPRHIQVYMNGSLAWDLQVTSAVLNY